MLSKNETMGMFRQKKQHVNLKFAYVTELCMGKLDRKKLKIVFFDQKRYSILVGERIK